jgi:peptide subunit release factor 1 (eRF1)
LTRKVTVPFRRIEGWFERFDARHPDCSWTRGVGAVEGHRAVEGHCADGTSVVVRIPFGPLPAEPQSADPRVAVVDYAAHPWRLGLLVVRRGGFAVARARGTALLDRSVGKRHVQGRTKAGGWSQQRFARRRDDQARRAYGAAADHAARILGSAELDVLAVGGDRAALREVLADQRLEQLAQVPQVWLGGVGDPKPGMVPLLIDRACSVTVLIDDDAGT